MIKRFKKWKDWSKYVGYNRFYRLLVLLGIKKNPSFDNWYYKGD